MPKNPAFEAPSANEPTHLSAARARLDRRLRARLRGAPMSNFRDGGPEGRFVLVCDRTGQTEPILLLSASMNEEVRHGDLAVALGEVVSAELVPGTWRRRAHTVTFQADDGGLDAPLFKAALGRSGVQYRVLLLQVGAA